MNGTFSTLLRAELRRMLTLTTIVLPFLLMILTGVFMLAASNRENVVQVPTMLLNFVGGFALVFSIPMLGVGMVATDVKEHWLRTLLMRPISRSEYLLARVLAVYVSVVMTMILSGLVPLLVISAIVDKPLLWMASRSIPTFVFILGHAYLLLMLLTLLSCWLPGIVNIVMLGLWAMGASLGAAYVRNEWWDNGWLVTASEFLFPSGFLEAAELSAQHSGDPMGPALWGIASVVSFTALTMWSVNRVQVDGGSE